MDLPGEMQSALGSTYRIERELGRGGMATVYLARLLTEIRVTANLKHPDILPYPDLQPLAAEDRR